MMLPGEVNLSEEEDYEKEAGGRRFVDNYVHIAVGTSEIFDQFSGSGRHNRTIGCLGS